MAGEQPHRPARRLQDPPLLLMGNFARKGIEVKSNSCRLCARPTRHRPPQLKIKVKSGYLRKFKVMWDSVPRRSGQNPVPQRRPNWGTIPRARVGPAASSATGPFVARLNELARWVISFCFLVFLKRGEILIFSVRFIVSFLHWPHREKARTLVLSLRLSPHAPISQM